MSRVPELLLTALAQALAPLEEAERAVAAGELTAEAQKLGLYDRKAADLAEFPEPPIEAWDKAKHEPEP